MEIKYKDNVKLVVNITPQMVEDWKDHCQKARIPGGGGKDCSTCSLNIDINDVSICDIRQVREELDRRVKKDKFLKTHDACLEKELEIVKGTEELERLRCTLLPGDDLPEQISKMLPVLNSIREEAERYKDYIKEEIEQWKK